VARLRRSEMVARGLLRLEPAQAHAAACHTRALSGGRRVRRRGQHTQPADSLWNTCTSGEGFITRFTGPGTVFIQTRTIEGVQEQLQPYFETIGHSGA
jgi:hypothetical protein